MAAQKKSALEEIDHLIEAWKENHEKPGYDPVPFLTKCAEKVEDQTVEFHKGDPDPFDDRHPEYIQPGCALGKILEACEEPTDKMISTYLRGSTNPREPSAVTIATARLLLSLMPGLEIKRIYKEYDWLSTCLYTWVKEAPEPLRTYATGLLVGGVEPQKPDNAEYMRIISILLKRLWNHVIPGKFAEGGREKDTNGVDVHTEESGVSMKREQIDVQINNKSSKKRKLSGDPGDTPNKRMISNVKPVDIKAKISKIQGDSLVNRELFSKNRKGITSPNSSYDVLDFDNDLSNSSWSEQMPVVVGCSYSLEPPLSSTVCQRFILDFLKTLGEYQDLLSVFLELKALDLINIYLTEKKSDGLLTFKVLEFLASLLCHNKVAIEFIELKGIQSLLTVQRPSMGSTGVSLCLYYLAYKKEAMERVCQLPRKVLNELVKYAIWLLECSHESGRSHAALFFSISFSFRTILSLFDQMHGIRCLLNMLSTSAPILNGEEENENDELQFTRQAARTVCTALKKYFEAHLVIKVCSIQKSLKDEKRPVPADTELSCTREEFFEHLEFMVSIQEDDCFVSSSHFTQWPAVQNFMKLDGMSLVLKVISLACNWINFAGRVETVRSALDTIAVVTLTPKAQVALCDQNLLNSLNSKDSGMGIILGVAEGEHYLGPEGDAQKSALAVIINCVCGFQTRYAGSVAVFSKGTPQRRLVSRSQDDIREMVWKCVQNNNGIMVLLSLLVVNHPTQHADDIRYLACKALLGLSNYKPVTQIMSKLPLFINGQIQNITRETVMHDKKRQHTKMCKLVDSLIERVSGRPSSINLDLEMIRKSHIVSETFMRFSNKQVLQIIHNHLLWSGLNKSADTLAREADLVVPENTTPPNSMQFALHTPQRRLFHSSNTPSTSDMIGGAGDSASLSSKRISFSKGSQAMAETPTLSSVINIVTPVSHKVRLVQFDPK